MRSVLLVALLGACATTPKPEEATKCEESRKQYCMTQQVCSYNRDRGCLVCQCSPPEQPQKYPPNVSLPVAR